MPRGRTGFFTLLAWFAPASVALAATDYLGVVPPKAVQPPAAVATCAACHGATGTAIAPAFPNLAGQNYSYLLKTLEDFRTGQRKNATMTPMIATVPVAPDNANLKQLAAYFSAQRLDEAKTPGAATGPLTLEQAQAGYRLYFQGIAKADVPSCVACHSMSGQGDPSMAVPRLAGQNAAYLVSQLQQFAAGSRATAPDHVMAKIAKRLTAPEMQNVSAYLEHMRPSLLPGGGSTSYAQFVQANPAGGVPGIPAAEIAASK
ncbi:MAG: c-type cytochrome [Burkholderiaceae bacterium]|nr:c-type cytochrome [Burkholderiaceae bacterium]